ncbi:hypothetical protein HK102_000439, partial [Quaeritorhiza haematococci]
MHPQPSRSSSSGSGNSSSPPDSSKGGEGDPGSVRDTAIPEHTAKAATETKAKLHSVFVPGSQEMARKKRTKYRDVKGIQRPSPSPSPPTSNGLGGSSSPSVASKRAQGATTSMRTAAARKEKLYSLFVPDTQVNTRRLVKDSNFERVEERSSPSPPPLISSKPRAKETARSTQLFEFLMSKSTGSLKSQHSNQAPAFQTARSQPSAFSSQKSAEKTSQSAQYAWTPYERGFSVSPDLLSQLQFNAYIQELETSSRITAQRVAEILAKIGDEDQSGSYRNRLLQIPRVRWTFLVHLCAKNGVNAMQRIRAGDGVVDNNNRELAGAKEDQPSCTLTREDKQDSLNVESFNLTTSLLDLMVVLGIPPTPVEISHLFRSLYGPSVTDIRTAQDCVALFKRTVRRWKPSADDESVNPLNLSRSSYLGTSPADYDFLTLQRAVALYSEIVTHLLDLGQVQDAITFARWCLLEECTTHNYNKSRISVVSPPTSPTSNIRLGPSKITMHFNKGVYVELLEALLGVAAPKTDRQRRRMGQDQKQKQPMDPIRLEVSREQALEILSWLHDHARIHTSRSSPHAFQILARLSGHRITGLDDVWRFWEQAEAYAVVPASDGGEDSTVDRAIVESVTAVLVEILEQNGKGKDARALRGAASRTSDWRKMLQIASASEGSKSSEVDLLGTARMSEINPMAFTRTQLLAFIKRSLIVESGNTTTAPQDTSKLPSSLSLDADVTFACLQALEQYNSDLLPLIAPARWTSILRSLSSRPSSLLPLASKKKDAARMKVMESEPVNRLEYALGLILKYRTEVPMTSVEIGMYLEVLVRDGMGVGSVEGGRGRPATAVTAIECYQRLVRFVERNSRDSTTMSATTSTSAGEEKEGGNGPVKAEVPDREAEDAEKATKPHPSTLDAELILSMGVRKIYAALLFPPTTSSSPSSSKPTPSPNLPTLWSNPTTTPLSDVVTFLEHLGLEGRKRAGFPSNSDLSKLLRRVLEEEHERLIAARPWRFGGVAGVGVVHGSAPTSTSKPNTRVDTVVQVNGSNDGDDAVPSTLTNSSANQEFLIFPPTIKASTTKPQPTTFTPPPATTSQAISLSTSLIKSRHAGYALSLRILDLIQQDSSSDIAEGDVVTVAAMGAPFICTSLEGCRAFVKRWMDEEGVVGLQNGVGGGIRVYETLVAGLLVHGWSETTPNARATRQRDANVILSEAKTLINEALSVVGFPSSFTATTPSVSNISQTFYLRMLLFSAHCLAGDIEGARVVLERVRGEAERVDPMFWRDFASLMPMNVCSNLLVYKSGYGTSGSDADGAPTVPDRALKLFRVLRDKFDIPISGRVFRAFLDYHLSSPTGHITDAYELFTDFRAQLAGVRAKLARVKQEAGAEIPRLRYDWGRSSDRTESGRNGASSSGIDATDEALMSGGGGPTSVGVMEVAAVQSLLHMYRARPLLVSTMLSPFQYNRLMDAVLRSGEGVSDLADGGRGGRGRAKSGGRLPNEKLDVATRIFNDMIEDGIQPDRITYTTLINGHFRAHWYDEAERLFEMMKSSMTPDVIAYTTMIAVYMSAGKYDRAVGLLDEMRRKGIEPNEVTYNTLLNMLAQSGRFVQAKAILDHLIKKMVDTAVASVQSPEIAAVAVGNAMKKKSGKPLKQRKQQQPRMLVTAKSYADLLNGAVRSGNVPIVDLRRCFDECLALPDKLVQLLQQHQPVDLSKETEEDSRRAVQNYLSQHELQTALRPDENLVSTMVRAYCRHAQTVSSSSQFEAKKVLREAEDLVHRMSRGPYKVPMTQATAVHFVSAYVEVGDMVRARKLFDDIVGKWMKRSWVTLGGNDMKTALAPASQPMLPGGDTNADTDVTEQRDQHSKQERPLPPFNVVSRPPNDLFLPFIVYHCNRNELERAQWYLDICIEICHRNTRMTAKSRIPFAALVRPFVLASAVHRRDLEGVLYYHSLLCGGVGGVSGMMGSSPRAPLSPKQEQEHQQHEEQEEDMSEFSSVSTLTPQPRKLDHPYFSNSWKDNWILLLALSHLNMHTQIISWVYSNFPTVRARREG